MDQEETWARERLELLLDMAKDKDLTPDKAEAMMQALIDAQKRGTDG